ncbi:MAG: manganese efflux pump MntP family protein [Deltaproteobacteria bacterium]|nr:manganese efflux pump MntP family protein [Deltaproteobacteria bacterium]
MTLPSILIIAVGLGMDAFSVAIGIGAVTRTASYGPAFRLSFHFGLFQTLMPIAGWFAGMTVAPVIEGYDHWVAFGLLAYVGGKMIVESFREQENIHREDPTKGLSLVMLSVATSIDALAVGLSFAFLKIPILYPSIIIGVVAFIMTMIGMVFGEKLGGLMGRKVEMIGGVILIGIGVKILIEHLT